MNNSKGNTIRLGIFVTVGALLLAVAIYSIGKKQQLFSNTFRISGYFTDISGLQVGNNVRFSGITIGIVEGIEMIADTAVKVDMTIDSKMKKFIRKDAKAIIGTDGLMGNKIVVIAPGTAGTAGIKDKDFIATSVPPSIDDILAKLYETSSNVTLISEDLSAIVSNIRAGDGTIGKLLMDSVFAKNIGQTIVNVKQGAAGFKQNMDAAGNNPLLRGYIKKKEEAKKDEIKKEEAKKEEIKKEK